ncbi:hypothetical protein VKT23_003784 [Stygiomarasmius scandens]|uniref:G-patch domain-containing protein n=1 Tax=Marasmiellus scandens TaxID=2682957 RepID=A0ABR1JYP8_9AGAR
MATEAYTIYSHYDPKDREELERETGQIQEEAEVWEAEARATYKRRAAAPPRFVPASSATLSEWSSPGASSSKQKLPTTCPEDGVAGWYRSLTSRSSTPTTTPNRQTPSSSVSQNAPKPFPTTQPMKADKNNWFIQNVVNSMEPKPDAQPAASPATLADILARDPPPLPSEEQFRPPVFLAIGPANKGFAMLQNSGWSEGEALGPDVIRRSRRPDFDLEDGSREYKKQRVIKQEEVELSTEDADVKEIRSVSVIDLTLSDDDADDVGDGVDENSDQNRDEDDIGRLSASDENTSGHGRKALITPLTTVLKSDRLGIGLKAKTEGPYKSSVKRVTHNAAALAAHLQNTENTKQRKQMYGHGRRGIAREYKEEQMKRQQMLAYFNS